MRPTQSGARSACRARMPQSYHIMSFANFSLTSRLFEQRMSDAVGCAFGLPSDKASKLPLFMLCQFLLQFRGIRAGSITEARSNRHVALVAIDEIDTIDTIDTISSNDRLSVLDSFCFEILKNV